MNWIHKLRTLLGLDTPSAELVLGHRPLGTLQPGHCDCEGKCCYCAEGECATLLVPRPDVREGELVASVRASLARVAEQHAAALRAELHARRPRAPRVLLEAVDDKTGDLTLFYDDGSRLRIPASQRVAGIGPFVHFETDDERARRDASRQWIRDALFKLPPPDPRRFAREREGRWVNPFPSRGERW